MWAALRSATATYDEIEAPVVPGAFIVNIGDCLMRWTNDVYVSTPHQESSIAARESGIRLRFSTTRIRTRWSKQFRAVLAKERSHAIAPILAADYLKMRLDASKPAEAARAAFDAFRKVAAARCSRAAARR